MTDFESICKYNRALEFTIVTYLNENLELISVILMHTSGLVDSSVSSSTERVSFDSV